MIHPIYSFMMSLLKPFLESHLQKRVTRGKEDPSRLQERFGISSKKRPPGVLIWFHAASVGESFSILSLIDRFLSFNKEIHILVTTGTQSSAHLMDVKLPERCFHQYAPLDVSQWVGAFLDHWEPTLAFWVESEIWPNLVYESNKREFPMILLNARMSSKSYRIWRLFKFISADLLNRFDLCFAQSEKDKKRLEALGAHSVYCHGNLKYSAEPLVYSEKSHNILQKSIGSRPFWVAASTHKGEETYICEAHLLLKRQFPHILTILVPRHPERMEEVISLFRDKGIRGTQRTKSSSITPQTEVYVVDTLGELGLFYSLASVVFVGGSFVPVGGHNLMEPAQLGCAILHGSHMSNNQEMADLFKDNQAALEIHDAFQLSEKIAQFLKQNDVLKTYQVNAKKTAAMGAHVVESIFHELTPYLKDLHCHDPQRPSLLV